MTVAYANALLVDQRTDCAQINGLWLKARDSLCEDTTFALSVLFGFQVH